MYQFLKEIPLQSDDIFYSNRRNKYIANHSNSNPRFITNPPYIFLSNLSM